MSMEYTVKLTFHAMEQIQEAIAYGNTAQKSSHNIARYDIIKKWINK